MLFVAPIHLVAQAVQEAPPADDIVVSGRLLKLRVSVKTDRKGRIRACAIDRTSGDGAFDRSACEATVACAQQGLREHEATETCVRDRMLHFARGQANAVATEERE